MEFTESRTHAGKLIFGVVLIVIGISGFLSALDLVHIHNIGKLWPVVLIALGVGHEIDSIRNRSRHRGYVLIAIGTWFLVGNLHLFGLSHGEAMPIALVIAGAGIVIHALIDRPAETPEVRS